MEDHVMESLRTDSLSELVFRKILAKILNHEFLPNTFLPSEKALSEMFGVGKSSIREAVKMLQILGVVESKQGVGTRICEPREADFVTPLLLNIALQQTTPQQLWEFREMFEQAYTHLALTEATDEDKEALRAQFRLSEEKLARGEMTYDDDLDFHRIVLKCTHNPYVIKIGNTVYELMRPDLRKFEGYSPEQTIRDHRPIMDAICTGDAQQLESAVRGSLGTYQKILHMDQQK